MPLNDQVNILIVDDRADGLLTLEAVLRRPDYNLVKASSGRDAIEKLKRNSDFALILLDVQMPELDGFQTATLIKQDLGLTDIPIIFVTAISKEEKFVYLGYGVGAVDYIFKPFDPHILQSKVHIFADLYRKQQKIKQQADIIRKNEQLENQRQLEIKASEARSDFFAGMSHDIRTPMNCIVGIAELMAGTKLTEEQANYIAVLNKASESLLELVNNILDLSKIESGKFEIDHQPFNLLECVESLIEINAPRAHKKGLELILETEPTVPRFLMGDSNRLKQILINLLANAVKFTKVGEITLSIKLISKENLNTRLLFSVKDTGNGIPPEQIPKIFDQFTQLPSDPNTKREGSGLGLAICKQLSELMNGSINVESKVGFGSTFSVELPFAIWENSRTEVESNVDLSNKNILVIDDNAAVCMSLSESFIRWGATVRTAANKEQAIQCLKGFKKSGKNVDFVFVDIRMPGVASGGLDILDKIKENLKDTSSVIVMMLPTNHRHGDLEMVKAAGISHYLIKPVKPQALHDVVTSNLNKNKKTQTPTGVDPAGLRPLQLLVVDDSEDNRFLIKAYFNNTPFKIEMAEDGIIAFEKFKSGKFDLVLMDLQMPGMDGYATLAAIRGWEEKTGKVKTPMIALTAYALKEEAEKSLAAGFQAHVTKPIRKNNLIQAILGNAA